MSITELVLEMAFVIGAALGFLARPVSRAGHTGHARCRALHCGETCSLVQPVYIEDTDAFGVVFYANYLRFYERVVADFLGLPECEAAFVDSGLLYGIESLGNMKFNAAACLGDELEVCCSAQGLDRGGRLSFGASVVRAADGTKLNSIDVQVGFRDRVTGLPAERWPLATPTALAEARDAPAKRVAPPAGSAAFSAQYRLQADELGGHGGLTMHGALRFFERQRSALLGGPSALAELQAAGVQVVVARITRASLTASAGTASMGAPIESRCGLELKARGTKVVFDQWLLRGATDEPLAHAEVVCLCVDVSRGGLVPVPEGIRERIESLLA